MKNILIAVIFALAGLPAAAQTAAELLQKAIYAQDTAGDLDGAIQIYRQIVNSAFPQRDISGQAQYRLVQALMQKGDFTTANTELAKLARDYPDWTPLAKNLAAGKGPSIPELPKKAQIVNSVNRELVGAQIDLGSPVTVKGTVLRVIWTNPRTSILVEGHDARGNAGTWSFVTAAPNTLVKKGIRKDFAKLGDALVVTGWLAEGAKPMDDGSLPAFADIITSAAGEQVFSRAALLEQ